MRGDHTHPQTGRREKGKTSEERRLFKIYRDTERDCVLRNHHLLLLPANRFAFSSPSFLRVCRRERGTGKNSSGRLNSGSRPGKRSTAEINYLFVYCWVFPYPYRHRHCIYLLLLRNRRIIGEGEGGVGGVVLFEGPLCVFAWHPL